MVCTRNRADILPRCLDAIAAAAQHAEELAVELVVVDNGSTDDTASILQRWAAASPLCTIVIQEPAPGLSRARNAGLKAVTGELVAMTDDDCIVAPDYLQKVAAAFAQDVPEIRGGRVLLGDSRDLPLTIKTSEEPARYEPGKKPGGFVMGANLVIHRKVLDAVGAFDERFGAGARFRAAEDTDYLLRASGRGFPVIYDPSLVVTHFHGRRSLEAARKLAADYSFGDGALYAKHLFSSLIPLKVLKSTALNALRETFADHPGDPIIGRHQFAFRLRHNLRGLTSFATRALLSDRGSS